MLSLLELLASPFNVVNNSDGHCEMFQESRHLHTRQTASKKIVKNDR